MSACRSPWMNPLKLCGCILHCGKKRSLLIPLIEISHELAARLGSFWMPAKAELIGHQRLLCVKSHLFAHGLWTFLLCCFRPSVRPRTPTTKLHSLNKVQGGEEAGRAGDGEQGCSLGWCCLLMRIRRSCDCIWGLDGLRLWPGWS